MLQFVDSFYCAYNTQKGNYVIKLRQEEPIENIPGSEPTVQTNEIASIILDKECALTLANAILQFQDPSDNDSDSKIFLSNEANKNRPSTPIPGR